MVYLDNRYKTIFKYKGYDICTLKIAIPTEGDELGYMIDDRKFKEQIFNNIDDAINAIDKIGSF